VTFLYGARHEGRMSPTRAVSTLLVTRREVSGICAVGRRQDRLTRLGRISYGLCAFAAFDRPEGRISARERGQRHAVLQEPRLIGPRVALVGSGFGRSAGATSSVR